jgi:hypothetical protein
MRRFGDNTKPAKFILEDVLLIGFVLLVLFYGDEMAERVFDAFDSWAAYEREQVDEMAR